MNNLQVFKNEEFGEVRVIRIQNEPWFVGRDVAEKLGYSNPQKAIRTHVDNEDKGVNEMDTPGGKQDLVTINESGLYSLVLSSKLENAKKFKKWVTGEILPTIRKYGAYMTNDTLEQALTSPDFLIELATKLKEEREQRQLVERELKDKNDFINQISASAGSILVRDLAHLITKNTFTIGEKRLWNKLREWDFICKDSTKPKQKGLERGFFEVSEFAIQTNHGIKLRFTTRVTGVGQIYIIKRLIEEQRKKEKEVACTK